MNVLNVFSFAAHVRCFFIARWESAAHYARGYCEMWPLVGFFELRGGQAQARVL